MGGLGNQLSQIFTVIAYSLEHQIPFCLPRVKPKWDRRPLYFDSVLSELTQFTTTSLPGTVVPYRESGFRYTKIPTYQSSVRLHGYFQAYRYFDPYRDEILRLIQFKQKVQDTLPKLTNNEQSQVSLHFRIGDYRGKPHCHPLLPLSYYRSALRELLSDRPHEQFTVMYCYQSEDLDLVGPMVAELTKNFPNLQFQACSTELADWEVLIALSQCEYNIIANSTFSWWGAYLNQNSKKMVYYPSLWFGPGIKQDVTDLFPSSWKRINV